MNYAKMNQINEKIFLGDCSSAEEEENLKSLGIKNVLSCCGSLSPTYKDKSIKQKIIEIDDFPSANIIKYFKDAIKFIDQADKILVHCFAGVSRSATLVIAYLIYKNKDFTVQKALQFVRKNRFVGPNSGFMRQLEIFFSMLKEEKYDLEKIEVDNIKWPNEMDGQYISY